MNAAVEIPLAPSSPAARAANDPAPMEASARPPPRSKRALMFALLALVVLAAGGGYGAYWKAVGSRYVKTDDAYTAAAEAHQIVSKRYEGALATYLDVLEAEDELISARRAEAELETRALILDVSLVRALGGGFSSDRPTA
jgi:hypothetical protein